MGEGGYEISEADAMAATDRTSSATADRTAIVSAESNLRRLERQEIPITSETTLPESQVDQELDIKSKENVVFAMKSIQARDRELLTDPELLKDVGFANMSEQERWDYITAIQCKSNSAYVLDTLFRYYPDNFESMFIVTGISTPGFKDAPKNSAHSYFIVKNKNGKYFSGTPANTVNGDQTNFDSLLEADDLMGIMNLIVDRSGGNWPSESQIQSGLEENPPTVKSKGTSSEPNIEFTNIAYSYPEYTSKREGYDFSDMWNPTFTEFPTVD